MMERFRAFWQWVTGPVTRLLIRLGVSANTVTIVGTFLVAIPPLVFFPVGWLFTGTIVTLAFVWADLIDGQMSRLTGTTSRFGGFLDATMDRLADAAIFAGIALYFVRGAGLTQTPLPTDDDGVGFPGWLGDGELYVWLALACMAMGATTSYARAKAESLGFTANVGITERGDRLVISLFGTGLTGLFGWPVFLEIALWYLAITSTITVVMRIATVFRQAKAAS